MVPESEEDRRMCESAGTTLTGREPRRVLERLAESPRWQETRTPLPQAVKPRSHLLQGG